ncbi:APC family permease [Sporosarcina limicola]|uniref:APA family basic amino acid/polyamine antiporter n=1 Tax=Sporosarcina limicola TaxID=34101 RepID=A0A927RD00_9BACL|nr:APC family permease [Sporosarcina limicola]MBE1553217.1 APA family basic amino acid/polyamine antiporter [Sporosarcina limicola]
MAKGSVTTTDIRSANSSGLKRGLGFVDLWSVGVGALIGGGIFTVIGPAVAQAGPALFIAFIIAGVVALLSTMSYAEMASIWPYQGASYAYAKFAFAPISKTLGKLIALWCAGLYFLSFAFAAGAVNLGFAGYLNYIFPSISPVIAAPLISILITLLLLGGIQATGKINTFFSIIQVVSLFAIAIIALFANPGGPFQYPEFLPNGWYGVFAATALIAFGQMQVEAVLTLGEEAKNPRRNLPLAQISALVTVVILYIITGYGVVSSASPMDLANSPAPLSLVMENVLPGIGAILIAIAALTATGTSTIGCILGSSRMLYAAARENAAPTIFGKVNKKTGAPSLAIIFTGIIALGATFTASLGYVAAIGILVSAAVFANWFMMAIMNIALIVVRVTRPELKPKFRFPLNIRNIPILAIVATVGSIWILTFIKPIALIIGFSWVVLLTIWYFAYAHKRWDYLSEEDMKQITGDI